MIFDTFIGPITPSDEFISNVVLGIMSSVLYLNYKLNI